MLIIIIILILSLLLFCGVYFPAQICDNTDNTNIQIVENNISLETALYHQIVEGLNNEENGIVTIHLDDYDVNEMLYAISRDLDWGAISVKSMYVETVDEVSTINIPVKILGMDSIITGEVKIYEKDNIIYAEVENIKLGCLSIDSVYLSLLNTKGLITSSLKQYHINSYFDGETFKAEISRADLGKVISDLNKDSPYKGLIDAIYGILMLDTDAVEINVENPNDCSIVIDLSIFNGCPNDEYKEVNSYTTDLINNSIINSSQMNLMAKYYINGYDRLADEEKTTVTEILQGTQASDVITGHTGFVKREKISLTSILLTQLEINTDYLTPGFKISDENINQMLTDMPFICTIWQYSSYRTNECAYIMIQSLYCHIGENTLDLFMDLNINGYVITVNANFLCEESPVVAITGTLNEIHLGSHQLSEKNSHSLYNFLCNIIQQDWIYTSEENMSLTLDFTNAFKDDEVLTTILKSSKNVVTVCKKSIFPDGGYININFSLFNELPILKN